MVDGRNQQPITSNQQPITSNQQPFPRGMVDAIFEDLRRRQAKLGNRLVRRERKKGAERAQASQRQVIGCWFLLGYWFFVVGFWFGPTTTNQPPTNHQPSTRNHQP
jgi:hypothetical protein